MAKLRGWLLLAGAALLILLALTLLTQQPRVATSSAADAGTVAAAPCPDLERIDAPAAPASTSPPFISAAHDGVRLSVDGAAGAATIAAGEHVLRAEFEGEPPVSLTLRVAPWEPVLVEAEHHPRAGITLVFLGAECLACGARRAEPFTLAPVAGKVAPLAEAAQALRDADTDTAAVLLSQVAGSRRGEVLYRRLAAWLHAATGQPRAARAEIDRANELFSERLGPLLKAFGDAHQTEQKRRTAAALARWNRLTTRYGQLVSAFPQAAPGQTNATAARLAELGAGINDARHLEKFAEQERLADEGEAAVRAWVRALRAQAPGDCAFQAKVTEQL